MIFRSIIISAITLLSVTASGQFKNYNYKFNVKGAKEGDTIFLANYFGKQLYYNDTAIADKNGNFTFHKNREIQPGQFAVVLPGAKYFEIIINEPSFFIKTDTADFIKKMIVEGSPENKLFLDYAAYLNVKKEEVTPIREKYDSAANEKEKEKYREELLKIDTDVKNYQKKIANDYKDLLTGQIVALSIDIDVPDAPKKPDGTVDSTWSYYYYRDHYFDKVNLKNDALVKNPSFHNKLDYFFSKVVLQHPDTICAVAERLVAKMNPQGDMFKYTVIHVTDTYSKSNIMGMSDGVFVCMADKFYLAGRAFWADTARVNKVRERAEAYRNILLGNKAQPLALADTSKKIWYNLYDLKNDYTVLVFWDPDCGHCKKEIPRLAEIYTASGGKDFGVYAVSSDDSEKWKNFINEHKLTFLNVAVPSEVRTDQELLAKLIMEGKTDLKSLNYHDTYDVYSTPKLFILDKDKKIVAKQIAVEQLEEVLKQLKANDKKEKKG